MLTIILSGTPDEVSRTVVGLTAAGVIPTSEPPAQTAVADTLSIASPVVAHEPPAAEPQPEPVAEDKPKRTRRTKAEMEAARAAEEAAKATPPGAPEMEDEKPKPAEKAPAPAEKADDGSDEDKTPAQAAAFARAECTRVPAMRDELMPILASFGVKRIPEIPADKVEPFLAAFRAKLAEIEGAA